MNLCHHNRYAPDFASGNKVAGFKVNAGEPGRGHSRTVTPLQQEFDSSDFRSTFTSVLIVTALHLHYPRCGSARLWFLWTPNGNDITSRIMPRAALNTANILNSCWHWKPSNLLQTTRRMETDDNRLKLTSAAWPRQVTPGGNCVVISTLLSDRTNKWPNNTEPKSTTSTPVQCGDSANRSALLAG